MTGRPVAATERPALALVPELEAIVGGANVLVDPVLLAPYGHDESDLGDFPPDVVVRPSSAAEISRVLRLCSDRGVPVTPSAARSGKSGGSLPVHGGVVLSVERMSRILEVRREDLVGRAQPGVVTGDYMKAVEEVGLFYPPDPASLAFCSLGGNVAENAGGPRALKYGVTREYILGLEVVLPTGEILRTGKQTIKGVAGFDLTALLVGSEGMLGVVTEITTQLLPLPREVQTALCFFPDTTTASRAVSAVLAGGLVPRALELIDEVSIRASRVAKAPFVFPDGCGAAVLAEVDGLVPSACAVELERVGEICTREGALEVLLAQNEAQRRDLWETRRRVSINLKSLHPLKISEDIAVPRSRIPEMVAEVQAIGRRLGLTVACYGHAGDGNLHANVLYDRVEERPRVDEAVAGMLRSAIAMGGTITGEHGVGLAKKEFLGLEQGPEVIALQRRIKALFDPAGILNPGKMFPGE
ncbi:MAG: FAD-binding oxidoreductase [Deltaproteobacteria bacterium]